MELHNIIPAQSLWMQVKNHQDYDTLDLVIKELNTGYPLDRESAFYEVLQNLLSELQPGSSEEDQFLITVAKPLSEGPMLALAIGNKFPPRFPANNIGQAISILHSQFRWRPEPVGIAGVCAAENKVILLPDLNDKSHPYYRYWIESPYPGRRGGIIAAPVLRPAPQVNSRKLECLAVLSILSSEPGVFTEKDIPYLDKYTSAIGDIILKFGTGPRHNMYNNSKNGNYNNVQAVGYSLERTTHAENTMTTERELVSSRRNQVAECGDEQWEAETIIKVLECFSEDDEFRDRIANSQIGATLDLNAIITAAEAADECGLAEATVRQAIRRGQIPARKSAGTWLVRRADVEKHWSKSK